MDRDSPEILVGVLLNFLLIMLVQLLCAHELFLKLMLCTFTYLLQTLSILTLFQRIINLDFNIGVIEELLYVIHLWLI